MITGLEPLAIKWAWVHVSNALAAHETMLAQHPLSVAANMAVNHGIKSGVTYALTHSAIPTAATTAFPVVHAPVVTGAVLSHGTAGTAAASPSPAVAWHKVASLAEPVGEATALYLARKTQLYRQVKDALSELFNEVKDVEDLKDLKGLVSELDILDRIREQAA